MLLKVLLYTRADAEVNAGGDLVEAQRLCSGMIEAGHHAVVARSNTDHGTDWDVVHLFNIDRAAELAVFLDRHRLFPGARVVLAPVYSPSTSPRTERVARRLRPVANLVFRSLRPSRFWRPGRAVADLGRRVDALHFHTTAEQEAFNTAYKGFAVPAAIIPPPLGSFTTRLRETVDLPVDGPFVAAVGRIEPLKNQLWLIESAVTRVLPMVFVGPLNPKRPLYGKRFVRLVRRSEGCHWLGRLEPCQVRGVLERATVHVLPSRRENFGLATLEALDAGCEAIVPEQHLITEVLGDAVHTFDRGDAKSLHAAIAGIMTGSRRAPAFARDPYTSATVTESVLKLYDDAIRRRER